MREKTLVIWFSILIILALSLLGYIAKTGSASQKEPASVQAIELRSFADTVDRVMPSVVFISTESNLKNIFGEPFISAGSGVILLEEGYVLTNRHVVEDARLVEVTLHDRQVFQTTDYWLDDLTDLAVVKIDARDLPTITFADSNKIRVGDPVVAFGHALGFSPFEGGASVTSGIVSNLGRSFSVGGVTFYDVIQTDAAINLGNSGGPLVNVAGELVGINSVGTSAAEGIGYAINVGTARHIFEDLVRFGRPVHPYLGVNMEDVTREKAPVIDCACLSGAMVRSVMPGSPAESAGLRAGDIIMRFDNNEIDSVASLTRFLWRQQAGDAVEVIFWRDGVENRSNVTLGERLEGGGL